MRHVAVAGGLLAMFWLIASPVAGQRPAADPDERALAAYRLNDATLNRFIAASRAMAAAARPRVDTVAEEDEDEADSKTIADIAAFYDAQPPFRQALARAGLTSREYVTFMLTLFQAGMAAWLVEQHGWDKLPPEIARENVVFYQRHKAQLDSLTAELKEREGSPP